MRPQQTATVHVCALRHLPGMIEETRARHLVSAIDGFFQPATPSSVAARHAAMVAPAERRDLSTI